MFAAKPKIQIVIIQIVIHTFLLINVSQAQTIRCKIIMLNGKTQKICQTCDIGYAATNDGCSPLCVQGCDTNEYCSAPNVCTCHKGYTRDLGGKCSPVCNKSCDETSYCSKPDVCSCQKGYAPTKDGCSPICENVCGENEYCSAPNNCTCKEGYAKDFTGKCSPICDGACDEASFCSAPNKCSCKTGYERIKSGQKDLCVPQCKHGCGNNQRCTQPDVCQCMDGYENKPLRYYDLRCQPMCEPSCPLNAYCAAPNDCSCNAGYTLVDRVCVPRCRDQCGADSSCIAPDQCHCNRGFLEQDGKCVSSAELRSCMKEVLFIKMPISCETGSFIIYLIYGGLIGILLLCGFITYKSIQHLRSKTPKSYRSPPENYIVTYQPRSRNDDIGDADCEVASPSYSQPPAYNTLTRKC